jgi:ABC-type multidrug transport system permease subunit
MSVLLGLLGLATLPAAIAVTERVDGLSLVESGFAIPAAILFGLGAVVIGRRIRRRSRQTLSEIPGTRVARVGRWLGYVALYLALTAALAVGFYAVLTYVST